MAQKLKIETNVPIPPKSKFGEVTNILKQLKKGDSVFVDGVARAADMQYPIMRAGLKGKATCRVSDGGVRVWRLE